MADTIRIPNFSDINLLEILQLTADAASGQAVATVYNASGVSVNDFILWTPNLGSEIGEILKIQSISGLNITHTTNFNNTHAAYSNGRKLFGDQIKLYRAVDVNGTPPVDSAFSALGSPVTIQGDDMFTDIVDSAGGSGYWYKATYYNSVSSSETLLTQAQPIRGGGYGHYVSIEAIRRESGISNDIQIDDTQIAIRRDQAESEINGNLAGTGYILPLADSSNNVFTPPIIEHIARVLAAGFVLNQDYGPTANVDVKDGDNKLTEARNLLLQIQDGTIVLIDTTGTPLNRTERVSSYPDESVDGTSEDAFFTMGKKF